MAAKKVSPTKGGKSKKSTKSTKDRKANQLTDDELGKVSGGVNFGALINPLNPPNVLNPKDLMIRQLTETDLLKVAGGIRAADQGGKSRQTVCR